MSESISARTPMDRPARAAGARCECRDGWSVAVAYAEPAIERERMTQTVAFADRSSLAKLELQAQPIVLAAVLRAAADGVALEAGRATRAGGTWWCPVTPSRVLALSEPAGGQALRDAVSSSVREAAGEETVTVADLTCGLAALALVGPGARDLLARFCAIDVRPAMTPVAGFRPGSIARTPGYLLRDGEDRLLILAGWAFGEYLWQVVADAAEHLGGGPVGADALEGLERA